MILSFLESPLRWRTHPGKVSWTSIWVFDAADYIHNLVKNLKFISLQGLWLLTLKSKPCSHFLKSRKHHHDFLAMFPRWWNYYKLVSKRKAWKWQSYILERNCICWRGNATKNVLFSWKLISSGMIPDKGLSYIYIFKPITHLGSSNWMHENAKCAFEIWNFCIRSGWPYILLSGQ